MNKQPRDLTTTEHSKAKWLLLIGVVLVASNLRVPLTSVGPLISFIREDLGISNALAGSITTLPLLTFALLSPFAPRIASRIGMERTIALSLVLLIIGIAVRSLAGISFLFTGTVFIGLAIAIGNVLIPGIVKINFPLKVGLMTGIYAIFMNVFGALGAGLSVPIASIGNLGWQGALGVWGILAIITLLVWLPMLNKPKDKERAHTKKEKNSNLWRSPLAWKITLFMGSQSLVFYTLITWLPDILLSNGYDLNVAGWMVFLMQLSIIPFTFIIPIVAERMKDQVTLSVITASLFIIGLVGLLQGSTILVPLWSVILGVACGSSFGLAMMFFTLRAKDGKEAAELSGMAQSFGYLLAAIGPVLVGALQDLTGSWNLPLILLILISITILLNGIAAGKERQITDQSPA